MSIKSDKNDYSFHLKFIIFYTATFFFELQFFNLFFSEKAYRFFSENKTKMPLYKAVFSSIFIFFQCVVLCCLCYLPPPSRYSCFPCYQVRLPLHITQRLQLPALACTMASNHRHLSHMMNLDFLLELSLHLSANRFLLTK